MHCYSLVKDLLSRTSVAAFSRAVFDRMQRRYWTDLFLKILYHVPRLGSERNKKRDIYGTSSQNTHASFAHCTTADVL